MQKQSESTFVEEMMDSSSVTVVYDWLCGHNELLKALGVVICGVCNRQTIRKTAFHASKQQQAHHT